MGIAAAIQAGAEAAKALFVFLATPEGQLTVKSWRESSDKWNADIASASKWIEAIFNKP